MPVPGPHTSPDLGSQSPRVGLQRRTTEFCPSQGVRPGPGLENDRRGDAVPDPGLLPTLLFRNSRAAFGLLRDKASASRPSPASTPQAPPSRARPRPTRPRPRPLGYSAALWDFALGVLTLPLAVAAESTFVTPLESPLFARPLTGVLEAPAPGLTGVINRPGSRTNLEGAGSVLRKGLSENGYEQLQAKGRGTGWVPSIPHLSLTLAA